MDGICQYMLYDIHVRLEPTLRGLVETHDTVVTVGDYTTHMFHETFGHWPDVFVADGRCREPDIAHNIHGLIKNEPCVYCNINEITPQLNEAMFEALVLKKRRVIRVVGEEDYATFLAKMYASDGTLVLWGDYDAGCMMAAIGGPETRMEGFLGTMGRIGRITDSDIRNIKHSWPNNGEVPCLAQRSQ